MAIPVFDGHNDVLLDGALVRRRLDEGHLDLARARAGGFAGGFFAIFTPHPDGSTAASTASRSRRSSTTSRSRHTFARHPQAARARAGRSAARGALAAATSSSAAAVLAVMHIEGAEAIDPGLELLPALHALGLRSLGITWSRPNAFAPACRSTRRRHRPG